MDLKSIKLKYPKAKVSYTFAKDSSGKGYVITARENGKVVYTSYKMAKGGGVDIRKLETLPKGSLFEDSKKIDGIFKKSKHTWNEVIETFENNKNKATSQIVDLKEINITQPNIQAHKIKDMLQNFDKLPLINAVEFNDGLVIYDGHHRLITAWLLGKDKIKVNLVKVNSSDKMAKGGGIEEDYKIKRFLDTVKVANNKIKLQDITVESTPKGNWTVYVKGDVLMNVKGSLLDEQTIDKYDLRHIESKYAKGGELGGFCYSIGGL
jgi:hypothetical protein